MKQYLFSFFCLFLSAIAFGQTQTITGNVYDEASRSPIIGAMVVIVNSNPGKGATTDNKGYFRIDGIALGRHSIKISYMGYEDRYLADIELTAGKQVNLNIDMAEAVHKLNEVAVSYDRGKDKNRTINDMAMISARSFNVDETKQYAGALGDPSRMAANFAGIVAGNDSRNDIVVRGNSPTGMLWQIEGLSTPNPNHFGALSTTGGPVSMLNSNNIDKSDFMTGAFPAQYGNAIAGVFDMRLRDGNMNKPEYVVQVGFNGFEGGAEGPFGGKQKASYLINYRYSTLGIFKALGLNLGTGTSVPVYQDVNYKFTYQINSKSKIRLFGIAGNSKVVFLGKDVDTSKPDLYSGGNPYEDQRANYATTITGLVYDYQLSERTSATVLGGYCSTYENFHTDSISYMDESLHPKFDATFKTGKATLKVSLLHKFNSKNNIQTGVQYDNTAFNLVNTEAFASAPMKTFVNQEGNMGLTQAYVQWKHRFNNDLSLVTGLHGQYLDLNTSTAIEPRVSLRYAINTRSSMGLGYGIHDQEQSIYAYFVQTATPAGVQYTNRNLDFTKSQHFIASYDLNISKHMRIKAEGYYQYLDRVPVTSAPSSYSALNEGISFAPPSTDSLVNNGTGHNYGIEITVEHFLNNGFYCLFTTSAITSKYKGSDGIERNTAYNTGYMMNFLAGKEIKLGHKGSSLAVNIKTSLIGGRYLTPLNFAASQLQAKSVYEESLAYSVKQDDYFRTDLKLSYKKEYKKSTMEFSLDLENITNHKNIFNQTYDEARNRLVNNYQQGFFPVPTFRFTF